MSQRIGTFSPKPLKPLVTTAGTVSVRAQRIWSLAIMVAPRPLWRPCRWKRARTGSGIPRGGMTTSISKSPDSTLLLTRPRVLRCRRTFDVARNCAFALCQWMFVRLPKRHFEDCSRTDRSNVQSKTVLMTCLRSTFTKKMTSLPLRLQRRSSSRTGGPIGDVWFAASLENHFIYRISLSLYL
jgi:hypothetical protein